MTDANENIRRSAGKLARTMSGLLRSATIAVPLAHAPARTALAEPVVSTKLSAAIPAGSLAQALAAFADQTGFQLVYVSSIVRDRHSRAVTAGTDAPQALARLLRGTGLMFDYLTPHSIRILDAAASPMRTDLAGSDEMTDEVIVTANRRNESVQSVPITIQVLTSATLSALNATTFEDFVSYLPGVTAHGVGPAQNSIYVRGLATTEAGNQLAGTNGVFPNVAVYLDEQSAQLPGRNLDIYAADLDRIEVLEGPQGTLFGAGAESGVIRYITNKPKLDVMEGYADAHSSVTAHGEPGSAVTAVINVPLIENTLALRGVVYDDRRGGYIDNRPASFARLPSDASIAYANYPAGCGIGGAPACEVPPNSPVIDNAALVARAINPVTYQGVRVQALYQFNDDLNVLLAQSYQSMRADGVFAESVTDSVGVPQPPLTTQLFNPSYDKDRFENTALTVNGRLGALNLLYAGAYSVRNVEQVQDYTNYARGGRYADYYQCVNPGPTSATAQCFTPSSVWRDRERNTHLSQEFRVSTPAQRRLRMIGGLFYEDYKIQDQDDWFYLTALPYFYPIGPPTAYYSLDGRAVSASQGYGNGAILLPGGVTSNNPNVRPPGDGFFNDTTRGYRQESLFASADLDLVQDVLTFTAGTRYFRSDAAEVGSQMTSTGCSTLFPGASSPCLNISATNLDALGLRRRYSGFRSRMSLRWTLSADAMVYATWSEGFRSGGFNRGTVFGSDSPFHVGTGAWQAEATAHKGYTPSLAYAPDNLTNVETGWRSEWLNSRLQWNGTLYQEHWSHAQVPEAGFGLGAGVIVNGGTYRVRGIETSVKFQASAQLSIDVGAAWNRSRLVTEGVFRWNDGTPIDFSRLEDANGSRPTNFGGTAGTPLAGAPAFQGNIRARYEFAVRDLHLHAQIGAVHQGSSLSGTTTASIDVQGKASVYDLAPFTTLEGAVGIAKDVWTLQAYGENLSDTRAQLFANYNNFVKAVTVNRPRTIGLRMSFKFGG